MFADVGQKAVSRGSRGVLRPEREDNVMKNRVKQRENRKIKHQEELLDKRSLYGYRDLTPYNAVLQIKSDGQALILLK